MSSDSLVIIPTYNEIENAEDIIRAVFKLKKDFHILIVDDNSPDGTAAKVRELQEEFAGRLHLEVRMKKEGLGKAYIHGFKWALERDYEYIFEMDADFSHNPGDLLRLYRAIIQQEAHVAVGSRYLKGVINVVNWPLKRVLLSYGASFYVRTLTGMPVYDPTAGFICYHRDVIASLDLDSIQFVGYAFQIEMKFRAYKKGFKIIEIPIIFKDREKGRSKMSGKIINEAIFGVISMKWHSIIGKKYSWNHEQRADKECDPHQ
ncbi:polyprenol monophosphomannose synthase [Robertkochia aurantiaca]|uniref:polyprenol monophosphomannose synthase n=1 Tax=Robertkochia aurantiaca TaxID=2873700 RepID=UPI001CCD1239|nr:polyprenol monophosphomannose synthase [Robertkochia sp. 3YJGBD-33]